ncbi:serine threonine protein kinase [Cyclospora cayetanensis]|uniref:Serine threonine protein kinase n=1 Tax=Cyclospora cayetanensis TaxID=88456 RepID=A0A1D3CY02_9EIME|nr:serine threonine protein kinase [Cyclospora cayetanensis]
MGRGPPASSESAPLQGAPAPRGSHSTMQSRPMDFFVTEDHRLQRDFEELVPIGKGGFGRVVKARHRLDGEVYAIKIIEVSGILRGYRCVFEAPSEGFRKKAARRIRAQITEGEGEPAQLLLLEGKGVHLYGQREISVALRVWLGDWDECVSTVVSRWNALYRNGEGRLENVAMPACYCSFGPAFAAVLSQFTVDARHLESRIRRFLREVQCLRRLNPHTHIVRYFSSWLEARALPLATPPHVCSELRFRGRGRGHRGTGLDAGGEVVRTPLGGNHHDDGLLRGVLNLPSSENLEGPPSELAGRAGPVASEYVNTCGLAVAGRSNSQSGQPAASSYGFWCTDTYSGDNTSGLKISFRHPSEPRVLDISGSTHRANGCVPQEATGTLMESWTGASSSLRAQGGVAKRTLIGDKWACFAPYRIVEAAPQARPSTPCLPAGGALVTPPGGALVTPPGGALVSPPGGALVSPPGGSLPLCPLQGKQGTVAVGTGRRSCKPMMYNSRKGGVRLDGARGCGETCIERPPAGGISQVSPQQPVGGRVEVSLHIQMECYPMSLEQYIASTPEVEGPREALFLSQVIHGVAYCHRRGVIHRDLKPSNMFVTPEGTIRIGDFGLALREDLYCDTRGPHHKESSPHYCGSPPSLTSTFPVMGAPPSLGEQATIVAIRAAETAEAGGAHLAANRTRGVGTTVYAPPEQLEGRPYGSAVDIWALGMVGLDLFCRAETVMERSEILQRARQGLMPPSLEKEHPDVAALCRMCLQIDPAKRPSAAKLKHLLEEGSLLRGPLVRPAACFPLPGVLGQQLIGLPSGADGCTSSSRQQQQQQQQRQKLPLHRSSYNSAGEAYLVPPSPYVLCTPKLTAASPPAHPCKPLANAIAENPSGSPLTHQGACSPVLPRASASGSLWGLYDEEGGIDTESCFVPAFVELRSHKGSWKRRCVTLDLLRCRLYVYAKPRDLKPRQVYELGGLEGFKSFELQLLPPPSTPTTAAETSPEGGEPMRFLPGDSLPRLAYMELERDWGGLPPPAAEQFKASDGLSASTSHTKDTRVETLSLLPGHRNSHLFSAAPTFASPEHFTISSSSTDGTVVAGATGPAAVVTVSEATTFCADCIGPPLAASPPPLGAVLRCAADPSPRGSELQLPVGAPLETPDGGGAWVMVLKASPLREDLWIRGCVPSTSNKLPTTPTAGLSQQQLGSACNNRAWLEGLLEIMKGLSIKLGSLRAAKIPVMTLGALELEASSSYVKVPPFGTPQ